MRLALGSFGLALGYVMVYYAIGLYKNYSPGISGADPAQNVFMPFSYLLGFKWNNSKSSLPFSMNAAANGGTTTTSNGNAQPTQSGGRVELA